MQLKKRARRLAPTYDEKSCPNGTRRQPADFNQIANLHPTNNRGVQPRRRFLTPRESFALNAFRDSPRDKQNRPVGPMELRGVMPTIKQYNSAVKAGVITALRFSEDGVAQLGLTPIAGRNW